VAQARRWAHQEPPVDELVTAAVIGHPFQVMDREGCAGTDAHAGHGPVLEVGLPNSATRVRQFRLTLGLTAW
jgi:hypothetical protein